MCGVPLVPYKPWQLLVQATILEVVMGNQVILGDLRKDGSRCRHPFTPLPMTDVSKTDYVAWRRARLSRAFVARDESGGGGLGSKLN